MTPLKGHAGLTMAATFALFAVAGAADAQKRIADDPTSQLQINDDGSTVMPAMVLPESALLSEDAHAILKRSRERMAERAREPDPCASLMTTDAAKMRAYRKCAWEAFYRTPEYSHLRQLYPFTLSVGQMGGVPVETFLPVDGVSPANRDRVLINLHGGGFSRGARTSGHRQSAPLAAVGKYKVVSVDYRQAPEATFPAASEDVAKVYRELLRTYKAANIGIFGCSAGGMLAAQAVAWIAKEGLPRPGAVAMECGAGANFAGSDSGTLFGGGVLRSGASGLPGGYFKGVAPNDPLAYPAVSPAIMAKFPPSLLISSTRDLGLSSVVKTHAALVAAGVEADLHVWEGLGHGFYLEDPDLPESHEVVDVTIRFFDRHLGR